MHQGKYFFSMCTVVSPTNGYIKQYWNGIQSGSISSGITFNNPSTFSTKLFRTGYLNHEDATHSSQSNDLIASSMGYWKRPLEGWEIAELHKNTLQANPFAWNTNQNTGFQDQLINWHQFQNGSIYDDGSNWRVTNWGSGADATLFNYNRTTSNFANDNLGSIVNLETLR